MSITIGLVANVYNECNALPGWIETHLPFFDDIRVMHAGPQGKLSSDGTLAILEKWGIPILFGNIDAGFGVVRSAAIHSSPCEYVVLLDADERLYPAHRALYCSGNPTPQLEADEILGRYDFRNGNTPDWGAIGALGSGLRVDIGSPYDQGARLREILESEKPDALCVARRHWHDFSFRRPTQNWMVDPDWQLRIVRNDPDIRFDPNTRMHERLTGAAHVARGDLVRGPFFDHFHFTFKKMEPNQRAHDVEIYDAIHAGRTPPTEEAAS